MFAGVRLPGAIVGCWTLALILLTSPLCRVPYTSPVCRGPQGFRAASVRPMTGAVSFMPCAALTYKADRLIIAILVFVQGRKPRKLRLLGQNRRSFYYFAFKAPAALSAAFGVLDVILYSPCRKRPVCVNSGGCFCGVSLARIMTGNEQKSPRLLWSGGSFYPAGSLTRRFFRPSRMFLLPCSCAFLLPA